MSTEENKQAETEDDLADALLALRHSLERAFRDGTGHKIKLHIDQIDLTIQVGVTKSRKEDGGFKWHVLSLGAERSREEVGVQTLNLRLAPVVTNEDGTPAPDDEQFISGHASDDD